MRSIYLIRHGQASVGAADYDELCSNGAEQARVLGAALQQRLPSVDRVVCGAMKRHQQTARACLESMGRAPEWTVEDAWNEYDHQDVLHVFEPRYKDKLALVQDMAKAEHPQRFVQQLYASTIIRWMENKHGQKYKESTPASPAA